MSARAINRRAVKQFKSLLKGQAPWKTPYAGFLAYAVSLGIPFDLAAGIAYGVMSDEEITVRELCRRIEKAATPWR